ncbi:MAG: TraX family protein, partial [Angelakisella sp.]
KMIILRLIGRMSFPIFAFFVAEGIRFTHDRKKYLTRLLLLAVISEIPFDLMRNGSAFSPSSQNVCFTLAAGVACVWLLEKKSLTNLYAIITILLFVALMNSDYGIIGVLTIIIIYLGNTKNAPLRGAALGCLLLSLTFDISEFSCFFALLPLAFYNGKRGISMKYLFYLFYPLHMLAIWALWALLPT